MAIILDGSAGSVSLSGSSNNITGLAVGGLPAGSVSQASLATLIQPLGVGQTWTDVTASRASNTTYTNSTGRPIFISVQISPTTSGLAYSDFFINGVYVGYFGQGSGASPNTLYSCFSTFIIPSDATYKAVLIGNVYYGYWFELR